jgi:D-lactate dehydrogenase
MKIAFYSIRDYELPFIKAANMPGFELSFFPEALSLQTVEMAEGYDAVCIFTNDDASAPVIKSLEYFGVGAIAVRAAGYDNVDIKAAAGANIRVANVPDYSPHAIAEHTVAMMLALDRKLIAGNEQVHKFNFTLDRLVGFNLRCKTVGIIGTGRIGAVVAKILDGFSCNLIAYDIVKDRKLVRRFDIEYKDLTSLCRMADIITLHLPLNAGTKYLINQQLISEMKPGVMLINTSRGAIVKTADVLAAVESGKIGYYGADVYEHEKGIFFHDLAEKGLKDDMLIRLMNHPNVLITPHQAFATTEALTNIATTTFYNLDCWSRHVNSENERTDLHVEINASWNE